MEFMRPKVSFVVVGRNDNYGVDFLRRMQASVEVLLTLCEKQGLNMELVIVEWNPPQDTPRLADALKWPDSPKYCRVRIVEVPEEIHRQFPKSEHVPLFEYIGKNVGVRRARGEFVVATNTDILFSEELIQFIACGKLSPKCFYRVTRYDVEGPVPLDLPVEDRLAHCQQHIIRINGYLGSFDNRFSQKYDLYRVLYHWYDYVTWRVRHFPHDRPFTNASGDFFMMHQSHWHPLRGYPQIIGADNNGLFHSDAFLMYQALFYGLKQVRLGNRLRIYHQEHQRFRNTNLFSRQVESAQQQLLRANKPVIFNNELWGLGDYNLPESIIA